MRSFLQTTEWMEFQKAVGREVAVFNQNGIHAQVIIQRLPFGKSWLYVPHITEINLNFVTWLKNLAKKEKAIFIKIEPATDNVAQILFDYKFKKSKRSVQPSRTVILDLEKSEDELLSAMHHKTRYNIKVAEKHGITVSESTNIDVFWKLMKKTTARDKFSSHPKEYYAKMPAKLFIAYQNNRPLAGTMIHFYGDTAFYLHGASDYKYRSLMAPYKLHWEIIKQVKNEGYKFYDMWGINATKWPGVTRFKLGWGGRVVEYPGAFDLPIKYFWYLGYKIFRKIF